jgi:WD40 repeat protein
MSRRYHAFMSYSHRVDRELARTFQSDLERFGGRYPWSRVLRVFRDETNLSATPHLWTEIEKALDDSERLILLASPPSTKSEWIPRELERFVSLRGAAYLCIVLTMGKTSYTDGSGFTEEEAALAPATIELLGAQDQPLLIDLRPFRARPHRARWSRDYLNRVAAVASFVSARDKDELFSEHIARQRRWLWMLAITAILIATLAAAAIQQTLAERTATRRAIDGERTARREQARTERLRAITDVQLRAAQARLLAREQPHVALATAAQSWTGRPAERVAESDPAVDALAKRAGIQAAAALAEVLGAHPGLVGHLHGHTGAIETLAVDGDGTLLSAAGDGRVILWDLAARSHQTVLVHPNGTRLQRAARGDGIVAAASEGDVVVWEGDTPRIHPIGNISALAIRKGGDLIALGTGDGDVLLLDRVSGASSLLDRRGGYIGGLTFSPDGTRLYVGAFSEANRVDIWDVNTRRRKGSGLRGHNLAATHIAVSADGSRIAAATEADEVVVWKSSGEILARWLPETTVTAVVFDHRRAERVYSVQADGSLAVWEGAGESAPKQVRYAHRGGAYAVAFDSGTGRVITGGSDGVIRLWDPEFVHPLVTTVAGSAGYGVLSRFDGDRIVALGPTGLRRWSSDLTTWTDVALAIPSSMVAIALGAGDLVIAAPPWDSTNHDLLVWSARTNQEVARLTNPSRSLVPAVLSPDARIFIGSAPGQQGGLWRWDLDGAAAVRRELAPWPAADEVAFDPTGARLVAALTHDELVVWDVATGDERARALIESPESVTALALAGSGEVLALGRLRGEERPTRLQSNW